MQPGPLRIRYARAMAHAYVVEGDREAGIVAARLHADTALGLVGLPHPDVVVFEYGLFSVDDARAVAQFASSSPVQADAKMVVVAATRIFHEAQNALLKLFEEPPVGVTMVLVVPSLGQLLPTLQSRVQVLASSGSLDSPAQAFVSLDTSAREKYISKLIDRTKSDKDEDKQAARGELLTLVEDLIRIANARRASGSPEEQKELVAFLQDLDTFLPILHERSAPLKLIFEHISLVLPKSLAT